MTTTHSDPTTGPPIGSRDGYNLYIVRFVQVFETFRLPELKSLATLHGIELTIVDYSEHVGSIQFL
jgi:hypothetical protein